ncbi:MAG: hypothetical protein K2L35_05120 [Muribaculaceae bacterium]|nr:hypothetical protein [Muribaculaceae bacterium]
MNNGISIWNGYPVHGDIKELDRIIEWGGVSQNYIFNLLSAEGESYVTSGVNARLVEAFNEAVNALPCKVDKVEELLIVLRWGNPQTDTCEQLSSIYDMLSDIKSVWDVSANESFGNSCRVVLVASVKA